MELQTEFKTKIRLILDQEQIESLLSKKLNSGGATLKTKLTSATWNAVSAVKPSSRTGSGIFRPAVRNHC